MEDPKEDGDLQACYKRFILDHDGGGTKYQTTYIMDLPRVLGSPGEETCTNAFVPAGCVKRQCPMSFTQCWLRLVLSGS